MPTSPNGRQIKPKGDTEMTRTYYIEHKTVNGTKFDKVTYTSVEDRASWHKVEALNEWKKEHKGYAKLTIKNVHTIKEYKELMKA